MSVTRPRSKIDKNKTDDLSSGIERPVGFENVVRWCVIAVALTLAGFLGLSRRSSQGSLQGEQKPAWSRARSARIEPSNSRSVWSRRPARKLFC